MLPDEQRVKFEHDVSPLLEGSIVPKREVMHFLKLCTAYFPQTVHSALGIGDRVQRDFWVTYEIDRLDVTRRYHEGMPSLEALCSTITTGLNEDKMPLSDETKRGKVVYFSPLIEREAGGAFEKALLLHLIMQERAKSYFIRGGVSERSGKHRLHSYTIIMHEGGPTLVDIAPLVKIVGEELPPPLIFPVEGIDFPELTFSTSQESFLKRTYKM